MQEKIVGILGGMGPFATADFFQKILVSTPAKKDWEHLHILIDNNTKIPSRTRAVLYQEESPVSGMIESINKLASMGADFVVVPCNSAHYFYRDVVSSIKIPWLNMIEITAKAVSENKKSKPLVLGGYVTVRKKLYSKFLPEAVYLSDQENSFLEEVIEEIKLTSKLSAASRDRLIEIVDNKKEGIDSVIFACTELPIVFKDKKISGLEIIDSSSEYAKETIAFSKGLNADDL